MRGHLLAVLLGALALPAAHGQDSIYVGVGFGDFDYQENRNDPILGNFSDSVGTWELFGGFELNDHLALEISYRESSTLIQSGTAVVDQIGELNLTLSQDFAMTVLKAVGQYPREWGVLMAGLGFFSSENDFREDVTADGFPPFVNTGSFSDNGLAAMLGIEWRFGRFGTRYGVRLEYEWWDLDAVDASALGLAFSYGF